MTAEPEKKKTKKRFDCVAFERDQRDRIGRMLNAMTREERVDRLCNVETTDAILRRSAEIAPHGTPCTGGVPPPLSANVRDTAGMPLNSGGHTLVRRIDGKTRAET